MEKSNGRAGAFSVPAAQESAEAAAFQPADRDNFGQLAASPDLLLAEGQGDQREAAQVEPDLRCVGGIRAAAEADARVGAGDLEYGAAHARVPADNAAARDVVVAAEPFADSSALLQAVFVLGLDIQDAVVGSQQEAVGAELGVDCVRADKGALRCSSEDDSGQTADRQVQGDLGLDADTAIDGETDANIGPERAAYCGPEIPQGAAADN